MNIISRRSFLHHTGFLTLSAFGLGHLVSGLFGRRAWAANPDSERKLIFIFLSGGSDGINAVIPRGDPDYNTTTRPTLFLPEALALDTGNGFAQLHPRLQPMLELYNHSRLNGQDGPGNLAILHRVGYADQSRSHFDSQQFWQNGVPGDSRLEEGVFYRHLERTVDLDDQRNAFVAAAISSSQMTALKGAKPIPNFSRATSFSFGAGPAKTQKFLGQLPTAPRGTDGAGLLGLYGGPADSAAKPYRSLIHQTGQLLGATMTTLQNAVAEGAYEPENNAVYPNSSFGDKLQQAAMLFKRTPAKVIGLNLGAWDTHSDQGQINGLHGNLLEGLAQGFQALYRDLQSQWHRLLIVTMTEFGRTSKENGSGGTDHGESSIMFVAGGGVKGGVYNCDTKTWKPGDMFSANERYLSRRTDFRAVLGEIFTRHLRDSPALLDIIIPGYTEAASQYPDTFKFLDFLSA